MILTVEIEHRDLPLVVEVDVVREPYPASRHMPGEGADFTLAAVYLHGASIDILPRLSHRWRRGLEDSDALQSAVNRLFE